MDGIEEVLQGVSKEYLIILVVVSLLFQVVWLILGYTISSTVKLIRKENRCLAPSQAWILAIPLINIFYNFIIIRKLSDSLNNEFYDRKEAVDENPTLKQGYFMAYSFLVANLPLPPFVAYVFIFGCLICYINYLVKIVEHKRLLKQPRPLVEENEI